MQALITHFSWNQCGQHGAAGTGTGAQLSMSASLHMCFQPWNNPHGMDILGWYSSLHLTSFKGLLNPFPVDWYSINHSNMPAMMFLLIATEEMGGSRPWGEHRHFPCKCQGRLTDNSNLQNVWGSSKKLPIIPPPGTSQLENMPVTGVTSAAFFCPGDQCFEEKHAHVQVCELQLPAGHTKGKLAPVTMYYKSSHSQGTKLLSCFLIIINYKDTITHVCSLWTVLW